MPGPACTANAFIGQFTVQATDFNILLISIVVLLTVTNQYVYSRPSQRQIAMLCVAPWIPSVITGTRSHPFNIKEEASTNPRPSKHRPRPPRLRSHIRQLCWITPQHVTLRYALTHGWRIAIFLTTICIYTYVYFRLTRTYGNIWARTRESSRATKEEEESQLCPTAAPPNTTTTTAATKTPSTRTHSIKISLGHISTQKQHDSPPPSPPSPQTTRASARTGQKNCEGSCC